MAGRTLAKKEAKQGAPLSLSETFNQWLNDLWEGRTSALMPNVHFDWQPRVDIQETDKEYIINASLPGVDKNNINIQVSDHTLSIQGERSQESQEKEKGGFIRQEQTYGSFYRSFELPENVKSDAIQASDKNGVLEIHIPKAEGQPSKARKVNVE